ncbi:hypothetical protein RRF57_006024 [Xylaria bambusicola]|uniref:Uncharacterized protein n=1 Tax=Xylaria bambusicola TaxID=326684 RepID=A0AAN7UN32_9PEZI
MSRYVNIVFFSYDILSRQSRASGLILVYDEFDAFMAVGMYQPNSAYLTCASLDLLTIRLVNTTKAIRVTVCEIEEDGTEVILHS